MPGRDGGSWVRAVTIKMDKRERRLDVCKRKNQQN